MTRGKTTLTSYLVLAAIALAGCHRQAIDFNNQIAEAPTRLGKAAIPSLEQRKNRAPDLKARALFELALAAIRGAVDEDLVRQLFAGTSEEKLLAVEIVVAGGSRKWKRELQAMLKDEHPRTRKAAEEALESLHAER